MAQILPISRLGHWEGYEVRDERIERRGKASWCVIRLEQQRLGMQPEDGRAGMNLLQALQRESPTP